MDFNQITWNKEDFDKCAIRDLESIVLLSDEPDINM